MVKIVNICAVVVTYNRKTLLEECLRSLEDQTRPLDEIIVIDNASFDGTDETIKTKFTGITYVKLAENIGGAGGFYEGIKLAYEKGHDWVWVMDDDAIPRSDALEKLENCHLIKESGVYALASTVLKEDGSISLIHRRIVNVKNLKEEPVDAAEYQANYFQVDTASFVGLLVGRNAIDDIGLPLRDFFIYYDDTEYSLRMKGKGTIYTVSDSIITHPQGWDDSSKSIINTQALTWRQYYSFRNYIYTYIKYSRPGPLFYGRLFAGIIIEILLTLFVRHRKYQSIKIVIHSRLDGIRGKLGKNIDFLAD
jgi:GT2 family glycosyltransferase